MIAFIQENLIQNNAWYSILQGLLVTIQITAAALVLGTLLAVPVCMLRISHKRVLAVPAQAFIAFIRGTPVLMLLMLFYYVVFQSVRIDAVFIAIIAFSLNVSGNVAEIMRSAILSVSKPQLDSARALGLSRFAIFSYVLLPQASIVAMPVYKSAVINLLQWTCVVGYISITDLTRAINYMSTRTLEPFFMLFIGIMFYLGLSYLIYGLFAWIEKRKFGASHRYYRRNTK
ncbi:MAG: amino acid ABC transporter permease [Clostridiales bacterium]|nr:amino acid ABC transporter permease [Clostridiales bacterium]